MGAPTGHNSMAVSRLGCGNALVGTRRAISVLFGIYGLGNKLSYPVGQVNVKGCRDSRMAKSRKTRLG